MEASELKDALDDRQRELDERVCMVKSLLLISLQKFIRINILINDK